MSTKKHLIKEGIQEFKYEIAFIKHKLDLVENLIASLEEKVYSDEPSTELKDEFLNARISMLMEEYQKLNALVNPEKIKLNVPELDRKSYRIKETVLSNSL